MKLLFLVASATIASGQPTVALDPALLRAKLASGELVSIARARAILESRGEDVAIGPLALIDDLSRLARCLPLGRFPAREVEPFRTARTLVRLERVRLERRLREQRYAGTLVDRIVARAFRDRPAEEPTLILWPTEEERWPEEIALGSIEPSACQADPAKLPGSVAEQAAERARAERELLAMVAKTDVLLPPDAAASLALFDLATRPPGAPINAAEGPRLVAALDGGSAPARSAALLLLGRGLELSGDSTGAIAAYRKVLADPARSDLEDSRVRTRLVGLLEPDWPAVLEIARSDRPVRTSDWPALSNAEARALYAQSAWSELESFGRAWVRQRAGRDDPTGFHEATAAILFRLALQREPPAAIAWIEELGPELDRPSRLDQAARLAAEHHRLDLAVAIYDRLRIEAASQIQRRGPNATNDLARWTAERAELEYRSGDSAAFGGLIAELLELAKEHEGRPLARTAPHRQVARLCQTLLGRMTNDVPSDPERRKYAAFLLEATTDLARTPTRWQRTLDGFREPLRLLAGRWSGVERPAVAATKPAIKRRPLRSLGEVVVPRLEPRLEAPDETTPVPPVDSVLIHQAPSGVWLSGGPW